MKTSGHIDADAGQIPAARQSTDVSATPAIRIVRFPSVVAESGNSRSTIYNRIAEGLWPPPVRIGPKAVGFPAHEVAAMNAARVAGKSEDEIRALVKRLVAARKLAV